MKKKNITKLSVCLLALSMLLLIGGCGGGEDSDPVVNPVNVSISIDYPSGAELEDVVGEQIKVEEGSTVLDALQIYCNVNDVPVTIESNSRSVHGISGIDKEDSPEKLWQYKLNGSLSDTPASEQVLNEDDSVEWVFKRTAEKKEITE